MSTTEIINALPSLTAAERDIVRLRLDEIDSSAPLAPEEKRLADQRAAAYWQNPEATLPWSVAEAEIRRQLDS